MPNSVWTRHEPEQVPVITYGQLEYGTMFRYPNAHSEANVYMKLSTVPSSTAVLLKNGAVYDIGFDKVVHPISKDETVCLKSV